MLYFSHPREEPLPSAVYRFGEFSLHCGKFELCCKGRRLKLERKPLELLVLLVTKHGQVVNREEIAGLPLGAGSLCRYRTRNQHGSP